MHLHHDSRQTLECPSGGDFYRCSTKSYTGCCLVDACTSGCPPGKDRPLRSAISSSTTSSTPATIASVNTDGHTVYITTTANPSTSSSAQPSADTSLNRQQSRSNGTRVGAIAGGVVGGVAVLSTVLFLLFFLRRKKRVKEKQQATLPPPYAGGDMSEQLDRTAASHSETKPVALGNDDLTLESVPQLDGVPTVEANVDALGNIPELPAVSATRGDLDPFTTPDSSVEGESSEKAASRPKTESQRGEADGHVMSWSQFNSMGNRDPSSRLSQPHTAPDSSTGVWENMSPTKSNSRSQK
ncbi:hypothetical protein P280DRAFT_158636 [Massarina eburnea CBS 473.64]|uniref:Membrane anchor Opy2 N-terminal domain-containing protein n=1 Tax=Massarina eburnea CBS 473.64 TaxID=1395130 RepID=A0A6A6RLH0_9PLEO|nr:hypothetical protein P280DRAFT_158636 [Massarina eburnea CBS 473.64]